MRAQMGDTPRKQAREQVLRATDTFATVGQSLRKRVKTKSIPLDLIAQPGSWPVVLIR